METQIWTHDIWIKGRSLYRWSSSAAPHLTDFSFQLPRALRGGDDAARQLHRHRHHRRPLRHPGRSHRLALHREPEAEEEVPADRLDLQDDEKIEKAPGWRHQGRREPVISTQPEPECHHRPDGQVPEMTPSWSPGIKHDQPWQITSKTLEQLFKTTMTQQAKQWIWPMKTVQRQCLTVLEWLYRLNRLRW